MAENIEIIRPINLPEAQQLSENDVFILDSETGGVRKIPKNKVYTPVDDTLSESGEAADAKVTGEKIDELKSETALIQNPVGNKSGELVSFSDGADMPAKSVVVNIVPKQSGTGTPSPDNVRQISGWESAGVTITDRNLADYTIFTSGYIASNGDVNSAEATTQEKVSDYIEIEAGSEYNFSATVRNSEAKWIGIGIYDSNKSFIKRVGGLKGNGEVTSQALTASDTTGAKYVRVSFRSYGIAEQVSLTKDTTTTTTTVNLGRTVYGGTLDVVSGVLTSYPFYPSYNGETLNGRWICDRAVYAEGTTPPTGSQVALISGTGTTYQLTPTEVKTLLGENNVWADSGDVEITYRRDINIVIDELTNAIISLGGNV